METPITTEVLAGETRFILQHLSSNAADGNSNHMGDVRAALEEAVSLEFADYLKFLKKFAYITLNRQDHTLGLTEEGVRVAEGLDIERFTLEIGDYFEHRVQEPKVIIGGQDGRGGETRVAAAASGDLRYVRYDEIGSGALGTVFRGRHGKLGIDVAIKEVKDLFGYFSFLKRETVARRLDTAVRAQAAIAHPSVVRIFDLDTEVAHPFYVMELCAGGSLRERLDAHPEGLSQAEALRWFLQILHGLHAAHTTGLLHRGLKPENVLLDALGNAKLGDFGISTLISSEDAKGEALPQVFLSTGGMAYLAPEQMEPGTELTPSSDLYAAGILLYELLVGRVPGRRAPMPSEKKRGVSKKVDDLFDKLTQDRPEDRYPDVDAVLVDFHAAFEKFGKIGDLLLTGRGPDPAGPSTKREPTEATPAKKAPETRASKEPGRDGSKKKGKKKNASGEEKASGKAEPIDASGNSPDKLEDKAEAPAEA